MKPLLCKACGAPRSKGRRLCPPCNAQRAKAYKRYMYEKTCEACSCNYLAWRKQQRLCKNCWLYTKQYSSSMARSSSYIYTNNPGVTEHKLIVETFLGAALGKDKVIHHLNHRTADNSLSNLIVISRKDHAKLHVFLAIERTIYHKKGLLLEWENEIVSISLRWLEDNSIFYIQPLLGSV